MKERERCFVSIAFLTLALCGCEMENQAKYTPFRESSFFANRSSARMPIPDTVAQEGIEVRDAGRPERGKESFLIYCSPCHGERGRGDGTVVRRGFPKPPDILSEEQRRKPVEAIFQAVMFGYKSSPPFKGALSVDEAKETARYWKELQK